MKKRRYFTEGVDILINSFLLAFLLGYLVKFGIINLIVPGLNNWDIVFNIALWYVMVMHCTNRIFTNLRNIKTKRKENV